MAYPSFSGATAVMAVPEAIDAIGGRLPICRI
jgi:hypothetical protein